METGRDGRAQLHVSPLGRAEEPASLLALRELTGRMMPHVDLPELLLEVHARTGFLTEFTAAAGAGPRMADLEVSVAAVLIAEACNIGFKPVTRPGVPALTRARLSHVEQNYVRAETLRAANARLIDAQAQVPLAQLWGGGLVASIDGLRFVVPVATVYAGANPRYFGRRRGATWLNAINDQVAGIGAQVVPGTPRDSLFTLDVMLNPDNGRRTELVTSDTAGYSDMVFGLYRICGMQYAPRLADLSDTRFWRLDPAADYGPLDGLARSRVRPEKIAGHWEQMLRIAGSLVTGQVRAYDLIRALGRDGNPTPLGQAFIEYGRIAKTLHLLAVVDPDDDTYRRALNAQLNVTESRHRLARKLFFGQRGELRQPYQEGQEDQLGALGLVLNAVVLWNTTYLHAALDQLRASGYPVTDADATRLSRSATPGSTSTAPTPSPHPTSTGCDRYATQQNNSSTTNGDPWTGNPIKECEPASAPPAAPRPATFLNTAARPPLRNPAGSWSLGVSGVRLRRFGRTGPRPRLQRRRR